MATGAEAVFRAIMYISPKFEILITSLISVKFLPYLFIFQKTAGLENWRNNQQS